MRVRVRIRVGPGLGLGFGLKSMEVSVGICHKKRPFVATEGLSTATSLALQVYNAAMVAKVNLLVDQYEGVRETLELLLRHVGPQAAEEAAEKQRRSEADAEARQKAAEAAAAAEQEAKLAAERREQEAADAKAKAESEAKCATMDRRRAAVQWLHCNPPC